MRKELNNVSASFEVDKWSREIVKLFLKFYMGNRMSNLVETKDKDSVDLICDYLDDDNVVRKIAIEIKGRGESDYHPIYKKNKSLLYSTTYNDHMLEEVKYKSILNRIDKGEFSRCYLISLFDDDVICVSNVQNYKRRMNKKCPNETVGDNRLVDKMCMIYNQDMKIPYFYTNNYTTIHFGEFNNIYKVKQLF